MGGLLNVDLFSFASKSCIGRAEVTSSVIEVDIPMPTHLVSGTINSGHSLVQSLKMGSISHPITPRTCTANDTLIKKVNRKFTVVIGYIHKTIAPLMLGM